MSSEVHDLLVRARTRIEKPENWHQGNNACGEDGSSCLASAPEAVCWCADGSLKAEGMSWYWGARDALDALLEGIRIVDFNDSHTHAEVLALFDKAIEATA